MGLSNHYTFPLLAKVSAKLGSITEGKKTRARILKFGFELNLFVRHSLIHMYSVCERFGDARLVFDANQRILSRVCCCQISMLQKGDGMI